MTGEPAVVAAAQRVAVSVLAPAAAVTDQADRIPQDNLDALTAAGLWGLYGPRGSGGLAVAPGLGREVTEILAAACGATCFLWIQHHWPVRMLATAADRDVRDRHLDDLCAGRRLGGVAVTHARRSGPPAILATPAPFGGYHLHGEVAWVTGWGMIDVLLVAAALGPDRLVFGLVSPDDSGFTATPLDLAVLGATGTVALTLDGAHVAARDVVEVARADAWHGRDRVSAAAPNPGTFGVVRAAVALLRAAGDPGAAATAAAVQDELEACRRAVYGHSDAAAAGGPEHDLRGLHEARGWAVDLAARAAHLAVAARGGRALRRADPAQRLVREAAVWTIQALTPRGRAATLERYQSGGTAWRSTAAWRLA